MSFKLKHMIFVKIAILLCLCLVLNNTFSIRSYADDAVSISPLFVPITALVTATAIGSGIIANGTQEAINGANQLVENVVSNIKASEIQKSEADANYNSPFRVVNGGQPEKPSNDNKNGKWVALGAGALASNEIWTNREAVESIMSEINKLNGYNKAANQAGIKDISDTNLMSTANASGIAQQIAQFDNRLNTQFTEFLNSSVYNDWLESNNLDKNSMVYAVGFRPSNLANKDKNYPQINVSCIDASKIKKIGLEYNLGFNTVSGSETSSVYAYSYSFYYLTQLESSVNSSSWRMKIFNCLNEDGASVKLKLGCFTVASRSAELSATVSKRFEDKTYLFQGYNYSKTKLTDFAYCGFKWASENPWTFTNNVYNSNQTISVNFPDWLQQSISLLGQQLEGIRLGLTTIQPSWDPTQEQIQSGLSPTNVINQYINNYENPEYIPEEDTGDEDHPIVVPPTIEEPQPTNDYLGNFLLPESITTKFPFCIPFDVARCLRLFSTSQREAPKWECDLKYGSSTYHVVIDLAPFNDLANFIRPLEYILFLVGLAIGTRSLMRG